MSTRPRDYSNYISQQWRKLAENNGICVQTQAVKELNYLCLYALDKILDKSVELLRVCDKTQLTHEYCETALCFVMPESLRIPTMQFATERVNAFKENWEPRIYPRKQRCSGLIFSLTIACNTLKSRGLNVSDTTAVFLTAVCEYISNDILDMMFVSYNTVYAAISNDIDLRNFFDTVKFLCISHVRMSEAELSEYSQRIQQFSGARFSREGLIMLKMYTDRPSLEDGGFLHRTVEECLAVEKFKKRKIITEETVLDVVRLHGFVPIR